MASELQSREIRVFLSSTFRDMEAERTYLVKYVFPKMRAACTERRVGFTEIDLRWGVTEEESKNGATVEICLKEIDRCRDFPPFFIGFLGERYGWIPRHDELTAYWERHAESPYKAAILDAVNRGISVTELEMELAVLNAGASDKLHGHAQFFLRSRELTDELYTQDIGKAPDSQDTRYYDQADGKLDALKQRIRQNSYIGIEGYKTIDEFGRAIESYLLKQLDCYFPADEVPSNFQKCNQANANFRYHRLKDFLPRLDIQKQVIVALKKRKDTPSLGPILLTGPSGQGKSALMADMARHIEQSHPEYKVIDHYIGADDNNSLDAWIHRILQSLHPIIKDISGEIPESAMGRAEVLNNWLAIAATRQKIRYVLVLDALDQLNDQGKDLSLLKLEVTGASATVICSAADGTSARESAKDYEQVNVPPLTNELRAKLIEGTLARYRKKLPEDLAKKLAEAKQSGSPLFLSLAIEELRLDARHETLQRMLDDILKQPDAEQLFLNHFLLDEDYGRPEMPHLAAPFMALLGASHNGLTENELADLLAMPDDSIAEDTRKTRLPQIYLSKLLTNFQPYLLNKGGSRAPMHRIFGEAALHYEGEVKVRNQLYSHFSPGYGKDFEDDAFNSRNAAEALYQATQLAIGSGNNLSQYLARLSNDLKRLSVVSRLFDKEEQVLFNAFNVFSYDDKTKIADEWPSQAKFEAAAKLEAYGWEVSKYAGWLRSKIGHAKGAKALAEVMLEARRRILGEEHLDTISAMRDLATFLNDLGDTKGAKAMQEEVLKVCHLILGEGHLDTFAAMHNLAISLRVLGDIKGAIAIQEEVLAVRRRILGEEHPETLSAMGNLANSLDELGDREGATALREEVLEACRRTLGEEHPDTLGAMSNLACSLGTLGGREEAKALLGDVLALRRRIFGEEHPDTLIAKQNFANSIADLGDIKGAKVILEDVVRASRHILGEKHPNTLRTEEFLNFISILVRTDEEMEAMQEEELEARGSNRDCEEHPDTLSEKQVIAHTFMKQGNYEGAKSLQEEVLEARCRILGEEHSDTLIAMELLAVCYANLGDIMGAKAKFEDVLDIRRRILGEDHPDTLRAMLNLTKSLSDLGDYRGAKATQGDVVGASRRLLGEEHPDTLRAKNDLAIIHANLGDIMGAKAIQEDVVETSRHLLGEEHPDTLRAKNNLAELLDSIGDFSGAKAQQEEELEIRRGILGGEYPDTFATMSKLTSIDNLEDFDRALAMGDEGLEARRHILGAERPDTLGAMEDLAISLGFQGDFKGAKPIQEEVVATYRRILGEEHPDTLGAMHNLAHSLTNLGDFKGAKSIQEEVVEARCRILGEEDPVTLNSINNLALLMTILKEFEEALQLFEKVWQAYRNMHGDDHPYTQSAKRDVDYCRENIKQAKLKTITFPLNVIKRILKFMWDLRK